MEKKGQVERIDGVGELVQIKEVRAAGIAEIAEIEEPGGVVEEVSVERAAVVEETVGVEETAGTAGAVDTGEEARGAVKYRTVGGFDCVEEVDWFVDVYWVGEIDLKECGRVSEQRIVVPARRGVEMGRVESRKELLRRYSY